MNLQELIEEAKHQTCTSKNCQEKSRIINSHKGDSFVLVPQGDRTSNVYHGICYLREMAGALNEKVPIKTINFENYKDSENPDELKPECKGALCKSIYEQDSGTYHSKIHCGNDAIAVKGNITFHAACFYQEFMRTHSRN